MLLFFKLWYYLKKLNYKNLNNNMRSKNSFALILFMNKISCRDGQTRNAWCTCVLNQLFEYMDHGSWMHGEGLLSDRSPYTP
jgi:hypothetical protein